VETLAVSVFDDLVRRAIVEDVGAGDVTTRGLVPAGLQASATLLTKQRCVVAGLPVAAEVFRQIDVSLRFDPRRHDGDRCQSGDVLAVLTGAAASMLTAERTALNFLQRLSGIATLTRQFVEAAAGAVTVLDTRKTTPTLRALEKYAVRCGGGTSHRLGLFDAILIKDNHVRVTGGVIEAVRRARATDPHLSVEVEAQSLAEVEAAIAAGADVILLDNLSDDQLRDAVRRVDGRARTEISGGVTLARMAVLRTIGATFVSVGALTHSAPAVDISLEIET
jgi:nicotinate-nucleotide pyrophosphorylase (carboxylating)